MLDGKVTGSLNKGSMWGYYLRSKISFLSRISKFSFLGRDFNNPRFTVI
jgi:hypothetical protein